MMIELIVLYKIKGGQFICLFIWKCSNFNYNANSQVLVTGLKLPPPGHGTTV